MTFGVTSRFFADIGLDGADDLPSRRELAATGLLSPHLPADFEVPRPLEDMPESAVEDDFVSDEEFMTDYIGEDDAPL